MRLLANIVKAISGRRETSAMWPLPDSDTKRLAITELWLDLPEAERIRVMNQWFEKLKLRLAKIAMSGGSMDDSEWMRWRGELDAIAEGQAILKNRELNSIPIDPNEPWPPPVKREVY